MRYTTRTYVLGGIITLFCLTLIGYTFFEARHVIFGPSLTISTPDDGVLAHAETVTVAGEAHNITRIRLNSRPIFTDESGSFREELLLPRGYTIMTVEVEDRFGRTLEKRLHVVRK